jgi:carboxypeptidase C (cathepsin A)
MKLFVASGFYDLATPFFATEYTLSHMGLDPSQRSRISTAYYEAGHMMYIHEAELARLKKDVAAFLSDALPR